MGFRFRRRARRRTNWPAVRRTVRAVTGKVLAKRVLLDDLTVPDVTSVNYDNPLVVGLLQAPSDGSLDEEVESDGTNVASVPTYSRITGMRLNFICSAGSATEVRWMLVKDEDNEGSLTSLATQFHNSDDTLIARELRRNTLAKGLMRISADRLQQNIPIRISRKALQRTGGMKENDRIEFHIAKQAAGTTVQLSGFGTIWVKANA